jgi:hypothetical protein
MQTLHISPKELIICLIKDDLINNSLINNFHSIGFYSDDYSLYLSDTIFKALGIDEDNDALFEKYITWITDRAKPKIIKATC